MATTRKTKQAEILREYGPYPGIDQVHGVTFDGANVWFARGKGLVALDPGGGELVRELAVVAEGGTAFDGRYLWQIAGGRIQKVDPRSGQVVATIPAPARGGDSGLTWAEGTLWVGEYRARKIHQIDAETGAVLRIVALGREEQKQRYLWPMLAGEELWCQLFSEPGAGSDLANLGTRAERDGDVYRVNGQKIWTSLADHAKFGILIARARADVSKHRGISYFIVAMDLPGIEVRPIRNMAGDAGFNEVFFTDVRVPAENLIGDENLGWGMAKTTLANERVSLSTGGGLQWGYGPSARDLVAHFRDNGGLADPIARQAVAGAFIEGEILRYHRMRMISAAVNKKPGPDASLRKALADPHGKRVFTLAKDLMGAGGLLETNGTLGTEWDRGFLFSPALTVGGGTSEVLRNIIAERLLGLPHDLDVEQGRTWAETRGGTALPSQ